MLITLVQVTAQMKGEDDLEYKLFTIKHFLWAITFSAIGDGCLVFPKVLPAGVFSFGVAVCIYINMLDLAKSLHDIGPGGVISGLSIFTFYLVLPLFFIYKQGRNLLQAKLILVIVLFYFFLLSLLLWSGILLHLRLGLGNLAGICSVAGVVLFFVSDLLIGAGVLWNFRILQGRVLVMLTYYTAQLLLAISLTV